MSEDATEVVAPERRAEIEVKARDMAMRAMAGVLIERYAFARGLGLGLTGFGGMRDYDRALGYDDVITVRMYRYMHRRGGIASRIVEAYPKATWRGGAELWEDDDPEVETPFEKSWNDLVDRIPVWSTLQRADILAGLSTFGGILIGAPGDVGQELPRGNGADASMIKFMRPMIGGAGPDLDQGRSVGITTSTSFDVTMAVKDLETDINNERFGQPKTYVVRVDLPGAQMVDVHWSRIIHVAEGCLDNDVYGRPVLEDVWNLLQDLMKVTGGGAEAFWLRANAGLQLDIDKETKGLDDPEKAALKEQAEAYVHQMSRILRTRGVKAKQLGSDVADFDGPAGAILKQISGTKGIPTRILTGSEMGQLASGQDADNWNTSVQDRRTSYAGPMMLRRLADRLLAYGHLAQPAKRYETQWATDANMSETEKDDRAVKLTSANKTQGETVFTSAEIREMSHGLKPLVPADVKPVGQPAAAPQANSGKASGYPRAAEEAAWGALDAEEIATARALEAAWEAGGAEALADVLETLMEAA